jgi:2,4-dienoyl-CoA reductase-like NADH-dependent reductase (Old Yellow Enzyme family)/thioredoxin reductase
MNDDFLWRAGRIGSAEIRNRVVMPAMGTHMASAVGEVTDHMIAHYAARARGGVGLVVSEVFCIDPRSGRSGPSNPRADTIGHLPMLQRLVDAVHAEGAAFFVQLQHPGAQSTRANNDGNDLLSPSGVRCAVLPDAPRALTVDEIAGLVAAFADGAALCRRAGADGVEIHAAHGYLIGQFLSPRTNRRTDAYGGTFDNRFRFLAEIVEAVRARCGPGFPIAVRLSVDEFLPGGVALDDGVALAMRCEALGVDAISVSSGTYESMGTIVEPISAPQGDRLHLAAAVKAKVRIPVIAVGVVREPAVAEAALAEGKADFVAIGRGHLADPDWCAKAASGRLSEIRRCIGCLTCFEEIIAGRRIACAVNPLVGNELQFGPLVRDGDGRRVVVVGGGPGGVEAARVLAGRGFAVTLFEARAELGGQLRFGREPPGKDKIDWLIAHGRAELARLGVDVRLGVSADAATIAAEKPVAVIVASGGDPVVPKSIPGIDLAHVVTAEAVLGGTATIEDRDVVVVGGGMTGSETAVWLAARGNRVSVVEMGDELCAGVMPVNRFDVLGELARHRVATFEKTRLVEVLPDRVRLERTGNGEGFDLAAETVVLALGVRSRRDLPATLDPAMPVFVVGDAKSPRRIVDAVREGHLAGRRVAGA